MGSKYDPALRDNGWYKELLDDIETWPLMGNPALPIVTFVIYMAFILKIGPRIMRDRKPMDLKNELIIYNAIQVIMSAWFLYEGLKVSLPLKSSTCLRSEARKENVRNAAYAFYVYSMGKFTELLDTVFFVLRKNNHQVTFLHLYHHADMMMSGWFITRYFIGEQVIIIVTLNSFIHVVMYAYYLIAALGPKYKKFIWWKKYMTTMQIVQFVCMLGMLIGMHNSGCDYNKPLTYYSLANVFMILILFINFYIKNYNLGKTQKSASFVEYGKTALRSQ